MKFQDLRLSEPLLRAIGEKGYTDPTPIQQQAIPPVLEGRDLQGCAQTGTGKTAAFTLPMLQLLAAEPAPKGRRPIRALVLTRRANWRSRSTNAAATMPATRTSATA